MLQHQEVDDINHKYAGSILFLDDDPIMCMDGTHHVFKAGENAKPVIRYHVIGKERVGDLGVILASDPRLSDGPYRLGYMNKVHATSAEGDRVEVVCYITRVPVRAPYKQGICMDNLHFHGNLMHFRMAIKIPEFADMLRGKYPTFRKAVNSLDDEHRAIAYHRHWAVAQSKTGNLDLHYRGQLVGTGQDAKSIQLGPKFQYLQDYFQISKE